MRWGSFDNLSETHFQHYFHTVIQMLLLIVHDGILKCVPWGSLKFLLINELGCTYG